MSAPVQSAVAAAMASRSTHVLKGMRVADVFKMASRPAWSYNDVSVSCCVDSVVFNHRRWDIDHLVNASGAEECSVQVVRPVGRSHHDDVTSSADAIHLVEQRGQHLLKRARG